MKMWTDCDVTRGRLRRGGPCYFLVVVYIVVFSGLLGAGLSASVTSTTTGIMKTTQNLSTCHSTHFECKNDLCIKTYLFCNGIDDCGDGSDEEDCIIPINAPKSCPHDEYLCQVPPFCTSMDELCGEFNLCEDYDAIDRLCPFTCQPRKFKCQNVTQCIPKKYVCDGSKDCEDGSDELNCEDQIYKCRAEADSFLCDNLECIFADHVCDGDATCDDGSDERNNCHDQCQKKNCGENALCIPDGTGVKCMCMDGFELDDKGICKAKEYCEVSDNDRLCSQLCVEGPFGPSCRCFRGYRMHTDGQYCNATGPEAVMYMATPTAIHTWTVQSETYSTLITGLDGVTALAIDSAKKRLFWAEQGEHQAEIFSMNLDDDAKTKYVVYSFGLQKPVGLAHDFITNSLYIVDSGIPAILACGLDHGNCLPVFNDSVVKAPKDVVVNPAQGILYYTETGSDGAIMKASMDGTKIEKLVSTHNPYSLEIDFTTRRLYWLEGMFHTVVKVDLDGKKKQRVLSMKVKSPRMISTFEDYIYWVSDGSYDVKSVNKFTGDDMRTVFGTPHQPTAVAIGQESLQLNDVVNRCSTSRCQMCLLNSEGSGTCRCLPGHRVSHSGQYCELVSSHPFLFASDETRIARINLNTTGRPTPSFIQTDSMYNVVALDYMPKSQMLVYSDFDKVNKFEYIAMVGLDKFARSTPIVGNLSSVSSIAVDETSRIVFWTDILTSSIHVASLDGRYKAKLPIEANRPHSLAIHSIQGILYFSEMATSQKSSVIKRCRLDGTSCSTLVSKRLVSPNYLFTDLQHLYWSDAELGEISYIDQWGSERARLVATSGKPLSFAIYLDTLYWTEEGESSVFYKHIHTSNDFQRKIAIKGNELTGLIVAIPQELPESACSFQNGGCDHICISIKKLVDKTCLCSEGYKLAADEKKCVRLAADECKGFLCKEENICISGDRKCDGFRDCRDESDEKDCVVTCSDREFQCDDGQCVGIDDKCDNFFDCRDNSDEKPEECEYTCQAHDHHCDGSRCISSEFVCDKQKDCLDGTDEENCGPCNQYEVMCKSKDCIPRVWKCDGDTDCSDGSDEDSDSCQVNRKECNQREFTCHNGDCIDKTELCDGFQNCDDGEDERNCTTRCRRGYFGCSDGTCIETRKLCNKIKDCIFGEDERDCESKCSANEFQCVSGNCVAVNKRCDRTRDCADGSDEENCRELSLTPPSNTSNVVAKACDGFKCGIGKCIKSEQRCDSKPDCRDNTDELNCRATCKSVNRCAHICVDIFSGIECRCHPGYKLSDNGYGCEDINECAENNAGCSHTCINIKESRNGERGFKCICNDNYVLGKDFYFCKALGTRPELYVSTRSGIKKITVEGRVADMTVVPLKYAPTKIEGDVKREVIYWTEMPALYLEMNLWRHGRYAHPEIIFKGLILGMALDWVTGNMYVMHNIHKDEMNFTVIGRNGLNKTILTDQYSEGNLVLHPKRGLMFWISSQPTKSLLKQAGMNGSGMRVMSEASSHMTYDIKILSIDEAAERLYWIDPVFGQLKSVSAFDKDVFTFDLSTNARHFRAMDIFEGTAYLLSADNVVQKFVAYGQQKQRLSTIARVSYPEDIKVRHEMKQPDEYNRCEKVHCMYMCVLTTDGGQCRCPEGYKNADNPSCQGLPTRVTFSHQTPSTTITTTPSLYTQRPVGTPIRSWVAPKWTNNQRILETEKGDKQGQDQTNVKQTNDENLTGNKNADVVKSSDDLKHVSDSDKLASDCGSGCLNGGACVVNGNTKQCRCPEDFIGKRCERQREAAKQEQEESESLGWVAGVIVGIVFLVFALIAGVCYLRHKRHGSSVSSSIRFQKQKQKQFVICSQDDKDILVPEISFGNPGFQEEIDEEAHMQENQDWWKKLISRSRRSVDSAFHSKVGSDDAIDGFMKGDLHDSGISDKVRLL